MGVSAVRNIGVKKMGQHLILAILFISIGCEVGATTVATTSAGSTSSQTRAMTVFCADGEMACPDGTCILTSYVCRGACEYMGMTECPGTNTCIHPSKVCDGFDDCGNNWDERNCTCTDEEMKCAGTTTCIESKHLCDGYNQCGNYWDEDHCYTTAEFGNKSLPLCSWEHLCETSGCSNEYGVQRFCQCDAACTIFNDCCIDYQEFCADDMVDEEQISFIKIQKEEMQCVELDSDYNYFMISTCNNEIGTIKEKCENPMCNDTLTGVPVVDKSGISYRNMYCAVCHGVDTADLLAWDAEYNCENHDFRVYDEITQVLCDLCKLAVKPPQLITSQYLAPRKCVPKSIPTCNDIELTYACDQYTAFVDFEGKVYKNPHCLSCSYGDDEFELSCAGDGIPRYTISEYYDYTSFGMSFYPPEIIPGIDEGFGVPLSVVLDFGNRGKSNSIKIFQQGEVIKEQIVTCPEGEVFVERMSGNGECVPVTCPGGFKFQNGDCIAEQTTFECTNNTIGIEALVENSTGFCRDRDFITLLFSFLFGENVLPGLDIEQIVCYELESIGSVMYDISSDIDLFSIAQISLENSTRFSESPLLKTLVQLYITKRCLQPNMKYKCDEDWVPDDKYTLIMENNENMVFLNETSEMITPDGIVFRLIYEKENSKNHMLKISDDIKICHIDNLLSCPFITLNSSLFQTFNSTTTIQYIPGGHFLEEDEYVFTSNDQILVCNFFNQSATTNVTEIVNFFKYSNAQTIVSVIGGILSLIAIIITFITYAVFDVLRNRASRLIMNLIIALFIGQFLLLFGGKQRTNPNVCTTIAVVAHYAWLSAFTWMNALAFDLHRTFGNPDNLHLVGDGMRSLIFYMIYAWGTPLLIVVPCIVIHLCECTHLHFQYGSNSACWISDGTANLVTFGIPAALFLLCNVAFFGRTVAGIRSTKKATARIHKDQSTMKRTTKELLIYIKIASLMGFTWIFGYIAAFTDVEALWYIYIILNSLQGVLIFLSFICNRRVASLWRKKLKMCGIIAKTSQSSSSSGSAARNKAHSSQTLATKSTDIRYSGVDGRVQSPHCEAQV